MQTEVKKYMYDDYVNLPEGSAYQLINGELIMSPAPNLYHQKILNNILILLNNFNSKINFGDIYPSPVDVYFEEYETYQPDIVFVSKERSQILKETKIEGAPDLVIEILSESSAYYDLKHKKNIYEKYGVKEYWIVDPIDKSVEIYENKKEKFDLIEQKKSNGTIKSKILNGLKISIEEIFKP